MPRWTRSRGRRRRLSRIALLALAVVVGTSFVGTCATGIPVPEPTESVLVTKGLTFIYGTEEPCLNENANSDRPDVCEDASYALPETYPAVTVALEPFAFDKHEVTNFQYRYCEAIGDCPRPSFTDSPEQGDNYYEDDRYRHYPVTNVTWDMADAYCKSVGKRLPTDAEWERVAKGNANLINPRPYPAQGVNDVRFDCLESDKDVAVSYCNGGEQLFAEVTQPGDDQIQEDGQTIHHMLGNVMEWTADWGDADSTCDGELPGTCQHCADCPNGSAGNQCRSICQTCDSCAQTGGTLNCYIACEGKSRFYPQCIRFPTDDLPVSQEQVQAESGEEKIIRGGYLTLNSNRTCQLRSSHRWRTLEKGETFNGVGFRCARNLTSDELAAVDSDDSPNVDLPRYVAPVDDTDDGSDDDASTGGSSSDDASDGSSGGNGGGDPDVGPEVIDDDGGNGSD